MTFSFFRTPSRNASPFGSRDHSPPPRSPVGSSSGGNAPHHASGGHLASPRSPFSNSSRQSIENGAAATAAAVAAAVGAPSCGEEEDQTVKYRVSVLGDSATGKTSLVSQFLTSEYMNTYDASLGMKREKQTCFPELAGI